MIPDSGELSDEASIFFRTWHITRQEIIVAIRHGVQIRFEHLSLSDMLALLEGHAIVHDNAVAQILRQYMEKPKQMRPQSAESVVL